MRAVVLVRFGPAREALEYRTDHPKPQRKSGEVLVKVYASSVNPAEWRIRQGSMPSVMIKVPQILGCDMAGVVLEADPTSKFKAGDRVVACSGQVMWDAWGTYAEFVSAREDTLTLIPEGVSFEQAAALPIAGMTAWQALAPSMPLKGKRVLVHGGAGGIGHFAVQIAKTQGAYVAATCSTRNVEFVTQQLGADKAIDYTKEKLEEAAGEPYDLVVDLVGAEPHSWGVLKRDGRMAAVSQDMLLEGRSGFSLMFKILFRIMRLKLASSMGLCPKYDSVLQEHAAEKGLRQLAELVAEGKVKVHIERTVTLEQVPEAHEEAEKRRTRGKVVIKISE